MDGVNEEFLDMLATRAWTTEENKNTTMDTGLALAFKDILRPYVAALQKCASRAAVDEHGRFTVEFEKEMKSLLVVKQKEEA